jgi:hypothetical protein
VQQTPKKIVAEIVVAVAVSAEKVMAVTVSAVAALICVLAEKVVAVTMSAAAVLICVFMATDLIWLMFSSQGI